MKRIDCSNMTCPQPVLEVKAVMDGGEDAEFLIVVDNAAALENVRRYAENRRARVEVRDLGDRWELDISGGAAEEDEKVELLSCAVEAPCAFLFLADRMGANPELGSLLVRSLLGALTEATTPPRRLIFMNEGVYLVCEGSPVLEELGKLEALGVELLACGTCLDFLGMKEKRKIGGVTNMFDTVQTLTTGHRVVTIG